MRERERARKSGKNYICNFCSGKLRATTFFKSGNLLLLKKVNQLYQYFMKNTELRNSTTYLCTYISIFALQYIKLQMLSSSGTYSGKIGYIKGF